MLISCLPTPALAENTPSPNWLETSLQSYRQQMGLPALAASIIVNGKVAAASAVGFRKHGNNQPVTVQDHFHMGSIAKVMTATLIARLVDEKRLHWNDKLRDMFPELMSEMRPEYHDVTVRQLLSHVSGMPYQPRTPESVTDGHGITATSKRYGYVKAALQDKPEAKPGTKFIYGGGQVIVANYAERVTGKSFEDLLSQYVFTPLGMTSARFGTPATAGRLDGPWEHHRKNGTNIPIKPDPNQVLQARSPVGRNINLSIADIGQLMAVHLQGSRKETDFLRPATFEYLHQPVPEVSHLSVSLFIGQPDWADEKVLYANGSNLRNLAKCHILPKENIGLCLATNIWYKGIDQPFDRMNIELIEQIRERKYALLANSMSISK